MDLALLHQDDGKAGGARNVCVNDTVLRSGVVHPVLILPLSVLHISVVLTQDSNALALRQALMSIYSVYSKYTVGDPLRVH
jgi:hypothetical protein